jgi:hypothetical protein
MSFTRLKRRKREPVNIRPPTKVRSEGHLQFVRGYECAARKGGCCSGKVQAAHVQDDPRVPYEERGSPSDNPGDNWTYPLCDGHHKLSHSMGHASFDKAYGIDRVKIAMDLWRQDVRHRLAWERKIEALSA